MKDLIERLKDGAISITDPAKLVWITKGELDEIIAALSAPLPDEVATICRKLDATAQCDIDLAAEARGLIERLARDLESERSRLDYPHEEITEMQQRIAELEKERDFHIDSVAKHVEKSRSEIKRLDAALERAMIALDWYRAEHPEDDSPMDDEFREEVRKAGAGGIEDTR